MKQFIVTVKLPKNPEHDPHNKKTGTCKFSDLCTDVTGEHHSFLYEGDSVEWVRRHWTSKGTHVTRVEEA